MNITAQAVSLELVVKGFPLSVFLVTCKNTDRGNPLTVDCSCAIIRLMRSQSLLKCRSVKQIVIERDFRTSGLHG